MSAPSASAVERAKEIVGEFPAYKPDRVDSVLIGIIARALDAAPAHGRVVEVVKPAPWVIAGDADDEPPAPEACKGCLTLGAMLDAIGAAFGREHWSGGVGGFSAHDVIQRLLPKGDPAPPAEVENAAKAQP